MSSQKKVSTAAECDELIEWYRASPCLWDVKSEHYTVNAEASKCKHTSLCVRIGSELGLANE